MNLYLDTEFDGHGGALISLAMAGDDASQWYGIFDAHCGDDWVAEHVAPKLYAMPPTISGDRETLRLSLREFLKSREGCTIWADWPADFEHLMHLMCVRRVTPFARCRTSLSLNWCSSGGTP